MSQKRFANVGVLTAETPFAGATAGEWDSAMTGRFEAHLQASWTQEQAIAFEVATESMTMVIGILQGEIYDAGQDHDKVASLRAEVSRIWEERRALYVTDDAAVAAARAKYGQMIRAWRERLKAEPDSVPPLS